MAYDIDEKLIRELREQANILLTSAHLLGALVEEQGSDRDLLHLESINKSLYCMLRTISHLELSGAEELFCKSDALDLAGLCRDLAEKVASVAAPLPVSFRWEVPENAVLTTGDKYLLTRAILNLLTNAFEAVGDGGCVELRCDAQNGQFRVSVRDSGTGPKPQGEDDNPLLKQSGGVGLGLKVARRVAELHGGVLMLEYGAAGTTAVLSLPLREPDGAIVNAPAGDLTGGFIEALVEFAPLLPIESFGPREVE